MSAGTMDNCSRWLDDPKFKLIKDDLRNKDAVSRAVGGASVVFHEAARPSVPLSVKDPLTTLEINVTGTGLLLEECRRHDAEKFVVASSSSVYGDTPILPRVESMRPSPTSSYAASKLAQESIVMSYYRTYGLNTTALRYFKVYGPRQRSGSYAGVASAFISSALRLLPLTMEGDGCQTRDFTFVDDVVDANIRVAETKNTAGEIHNVGSGSQVSMFGLADTIRRTTGSQSPIVHAPERTGDVRHSLAGIEKIRDQTGYTPRTTIEEGIRKTIAWVTQRADEPEPTETGEDCA
ncbi:MAG: GDP-mannose 4,6-dehydratase [Candidatus Thorarchaeota archaeon]